MRRRLPNLLVGLLGVAGCGSNPAPEPAKPAAAAPAAPAAAAPGAPGAAAAPAAPGAPRPASAAKANPNDPNGKKVLREEARKRPLRQDEYQESETNRDPFRSFLSDFARESAPTVQTQNRQYKIELEKFALEELKLVAIVGPPTWTRDSKGIPAESGDASGKYATGKAMFLEPGGLGTWVMRNTHFSKNDAKVIRVDAEKGKVFVELREDLGGGHVNAIEKVLDLHTGEPLDGAPLGPAR